MGSLHIRNVHPLRFSPFLKFLFSDAALPEWQKRKQGPPSRVLLRYFPCLHLLTHIHKLPADIPFFSLRDRPKKIKILLPLPRKLFFAVLPGPALLPDRVLPFLQASLPPEKPRQEGRGRTSGVFSRATDVPGPCGLSAGPGDAKMLPLQGGSIFSGAKDQRLSAKASRAVAA